MQKSIGVKVAIATGERAAYDGKAREEWCVGVASLMMNGELQTFKTEQLKMLRSR